MQPASSYPVTELLARWSKGDVEAREALVPVVYDELRRIARKSLAGQRSDHTLEPTALVHEAYLKLINRGSKPWQNRVHFFAMAARMMRQILVDHARAHAASKRGGGDITLVFDETMVHSAKVGLDVIALHDALQQLATFDTRQCRIVELRFFGGLTIEETAEVCDISPATIKREWTTARLWLYRAMSNGTPI